MISLDNGQQYDSPYVYITLIYIYIYIYNFTFNINTKGPHSKHILKIIVTRSVCPLISNFSLSSDKVEL